MKTLRLVLHMARADFLERSRTSAFLFTLAVAIYAAHGFLPENGSAYVTMQVGGWRGLYTSAWVGACVALLASIFLSLVGFYLVKNAVTRDRVTRVGEILAATPLPRPVYTLGKTLSNFLVLAAMTGVMALAAGLVQVMRAEDTRIDAVALLAPFVLLTLPAMLFTSALAVLFETVPLLSGGGGNVAWFFVWTALLASQGAGRDALDRPTHDWLGRGAVMPGMVAAARAAQPEADPDSLSMSMGLTFRDGGWTLRTFRWEGARWSAGALAGRLMWVALALGVALAAALPFDRFDPSRRAGTGRAPPRPGARGWPFARRPAAPARAPAPASLAALTPVRRRGPAALGAFATFLGAELRLALRDRGPWWYIVLAGLSIAALFAPLEFVRARLLPVLWVWPILAWSPMGTRERRFGTDQVLFSAPHPIGVQLASAWAAGAVLALATVSIVGVRLAAAGETAALGALLAGAAFVPALALALGVWTGTPRTFEAIYVVWWYTGPLQPVPPLDFSGASREAVATGMPLVYALAAAGLWGAAAAGRLFHARS